MFRVKYIGWCGHGNLGDEALFAAIKQLMPSLAFDVACESSAGPPPDAVLLGGGTLIRAEHYRRSAQKGIDANIPVFSFGTGVGVERGFLADGRADYQEVMVRWGETLNRLESVTVRGPQSQRLLVRLGVGLRIIGDPALVLGTRPGDAASGSKPGGHGTIGINAGYISTPFGDWDQIKRAIFGVAEALARKGFPLEFPPMRRAGLPALLVGSRCTRDTRVAWISRCTPRRSKRISSYSSLVGMRLHALVLAAAHGVPFVGIAYRGRVLDFCESIDALELAIEPGLATTSSLLERLDHVVREKKNTMHRISRRVHELQLRLAAEACHVEQLVHRHRNR